MSGAYRLYGAESSAYSTKLRSYLHYKGVPFDFLARTVETEKDLQALSRFPTLPVLVTAAGFAVHDTTPLMEALEADAPEPSATPADPALAFLCSIIEEYADTWLAKAVYHYRWTRKKDQRVAAQRAIEEYYAADPPKNRKAIEDAAIVRMLDQMRLMQLEGELGTAVEKSFKRFVKLLDDHLRRHLCIFGARPSVADFAVAGQLIQMMKDPTPAKIIEKEGEFVVKWCEFMADAKASGPFETLDDLRQTLAPLFQSELAGAFLPWAAENLESSLAGADAFDLVIGKETFRMAPLRSAARSFRELRRKFVTAQESAELKQFTDAAGATVFLLRPQAGDRRDPPRSEGVDTGRQDHEHEAISPDAAADRAPDNAEAPIDSQAAPVVGDDAIAADAVSAAVPERKPRRRRKKEADESADVAAPESAGAASADGGSVGGGEPGSAPAENGPVAEQ